MQHTSENSDNRRQRTEDRRDYVIELLGYGVVVL